MNTDLGGPISGLIAVFLSWIPILVKAILIFIVGWLIALILQSIVTSALTGLGLNRRFRDLPEGSFVRRITGNPAGMIGRFVYWLAIIVTITIVIGALNIPVLTQLVSKVYNYVPNILAAIVILLVALAFSAFTAKIVSRWAGDTAVGKIVSTALPAIIMSIALFAVLEQLNIAPVIVTATYIAIIGSLALGFALAFGLGGRDVASKLFDQAYRYGQQNMPQFQRDVSHAAERAQRDTERIKNRVR